MLPKLSCRRSTPSSRANIILPHHTHQQLISKPIRTTHTSLPAANTNISLPLTSWQLEVRMRWVKAAASLDAAAKGPASIHEYFDAHPLRTKLYSVGLMCSPRWALLWAWLFDREPGLLLLHQHVAQHQVQWPRILMTCYYPFAIAPLPSSLLVASEALMIATACQRTCRACHHVALAYSVTVCQVGVLPPSINLASQLSKQRRC